MSTYELLRTTAPTISVGVLTANWMNLRSEIAQLENSGVKLLHFDVMDGCFCPMMTLGPHLIAATETSLLKDVHLMIEDPLPKLASYVKAGADVVTVHVEASSHPHRVLQALGGMTNANDPKRGIVRGVALNPGTPLTSIEPLLDDVELIMLLAVNPGWGGQSFIPSTMSRIETLREMVAERDVLIAVDGGIKRTNVAEVAETGVDIIVTGSAVFDGKAPLENACFMLDAVRTEAG